MSSGSLLRFWAKEERKNSSLELDILDPQEAKSARQGMNVIMIKQRNARRHVFALAKLPEIRVPATTNAKIDCAKASPRCGLGSKVGSVPTLK